MIQPVIRVYVVRIYESVYMLRKLPMLCNVHISLGISTYDLAILIKNGVCDWSPQK